MIAVFLRPGYVFRFPDGERVYKVTSVEKFTFHAEDVRDGALLEGRKYEDVELLSPRQPEFKAVTGNTMHGAAS